MENKTEDTAAPYIQKRQRRENLLKIIELTSWISLYLSLTCLGSLQFSCSRPWDQSIQDQKQTHQTIWQRRHKKNGPRHATFPRKRGSFSFPSFFMLHASRLASLPLPTPPLSLAAVPSSLTLPFSLAAVLSAALSCCSLSLAIYFFPRLTWQPGGFRPR